MHVLDLVVLVGYFVGMAGIGLWAMRRIKKQEDFFLGGRSFGKILQAFAAFGAGTGSSDPINTARTSFTDGLSGMWSIMSWLFATPFYWIAGLWYRRMRHLTLGDWFVERYESQALGAAYTLFGLLFNIVYTAMLFTAIGKFAAPLVGDSVAIGESTVGIEYVLVPVIAVVVMIYGILGGLTAAYWTDAVQGMCIIVLSFLLIPFGLHRLVQEFGDPATQNWLDAFGIMHDRIPDALFTIVGSSAASEFPLHRIAAVVVILLAGVVVMPHMIVTGGGSAKSETNARVGLVLGNFAKRFCTIGWAFTALIVLALFADSPVLADDPDKVWGIASKELLVPGLVGLMLACLLAALMSSADCYMLVCSALVVRNIYVPYFRPEASEKECLRLGRVTGVFMIVGAVAMSWYLMDVFKQLQLTWLFPMVFAPPFWIGLYWRRATKLAAWGTIAYVALVFFVVPSLAPWCFPSIRTEPALVQVSDVVVTVVRREAAPTDVERRQAQIELYDQRWQALKAGGSERDKLGPRPEPLVLGQPFEKQNLTGGKPIFFADRVEPVDADGNSLPGVAPQQVGEPLEVDENTTVVVKRYDDDVRLKGFGKFQPGFLLFHVAGIRMTGMTDATLETLKLLPQIIVPFVIMILLSLVTPRNSTAALDRYYTKMKTPVDPDPVADRRRLEEACADPAALEHRKLLPGTSLEIQRPTMIDAVGFCTCVAVCFGIVGLAVLLASIGA